MTARTAIVTGGSRGIGRAIVRRLATDGARVIFSYRDNKDAADSLTAELDNVVPVRADQADLTSIDALFEAASDGLDILVNNAATARLVPIEEVTAEDVAQVMTVNATYPLLAMRRAATLMRDNGRIVNISTLNTVVPGPGIALYAGSKGALEQYTAVAAREFGPRSITVNTVSPGSTDTDMFRAANPPEAADRATAFTALRRLGQPDDIANVVAFLASPDAAWITGQNIRATGGLIV